MHATLDRTGAPSAASGANPAADLAADTSAHTATPAAPGRRQRKRHQTLDHLAATAFRLFEAHGYDAVTMEQIAEQADVAKGTLYNHFPLKEALLAHQFHGELAVGLQQLRGALDGLGSFQARLCCLLSASADWCEARRVYLPHYLRFRFLSLGPARFGPNRGAAGEAGPAEAVEGRSGMDRILDGLIAAGQQGGELRRDLSSAHLAALFHHLYLGAMMRWLATPDGDLRAEFAAIVDVFVHGTLGAAQAQAQAAATAPAEAVAKP